MTPPGLRIRAAFEGALKSMAWKADFAGGLHQALYPAVSHQSPMTHTSPAVSRSSRRPRGGRSEKAHTSSLEWADVVMLGSYNRNGKHFEEVGKGNLASGSVKVSITTEFLRYRHHIQSSCGTQT